MKVVVLKNQEIPPERHIVFNSINPSEEQIIGHEYVLLDKNVGEYDVEIGKEYIVYSIMMFNECKYYLLIGERDMLPQWFPHDLFEITGFKKPINWVINNNIQYDFNIKFIEGYEKLSFDYEHMINLIDRNPDDIKIFLREKDLINEFLSLEDDLTIDTPNHI